ncbi:tripartite tricarboxylate transporter TctB family protein [Nocardiopsis sp. CNS-639]|uniref:tripartite tricarboxylate transporter TctB family protein n=1 Tax=Nocardiopsis sp. CNS-639 TaxID=1169153 RepID=UPI0003AA97C9|nr:tripartite tricarboxylate transporter TctB family protein [Nocardiopsis sp. CNS-639]
MTRERPAGVQSPDTDAETGPVNGSEAQASTRTGSGNGDGTGVGKAVGSVTGDRPGTQAASGTGPAPEDLPGDRPDTGTPQPGTGSDTAAPESVPATDPAPVTLGTALAVPVVTLVTALFLLVGGMAIRVPESSGFLGPQFFPLTVGALLGVTACVAGARAVLAVRRSPSAGTTATPAAPGAPESSGASAPPESTGTSATPGGSGSRAEAAASTAPTATDTATDDGAATANGAAADDAKSEHGDWRTLGIMAATLTAHVLLLQPLGWLLSGTLLFWGVSFALDRRSPLLDLCVAVALAAIVQICFSGLLDVSLPSGLLGKVL